MTGGDARVAGDVIRGYREGDEEAINRGFNRAFHLERTMAEWRAKFPAGEPGRRIMVGLDGGGNLLAHYAALPARAVFHGGSRWFGQIVDVYCLRRTSLVRHGIFQQTVARFFAELCGPERLALLYGFPSERAMRLGVATLNYPPGTRVRQWRAHPDRLARRPLPRTAWIGRGFDAHAIDRLWAAAAPRFRAGLVRDAAAWRGRYGSQRGIDYQHHGVFRLGEPRAWAVTRVEGDRLRWADLVWDGRDPADLATLALEIAEAARRASCREIEAWLQGDRRATEILADLGFADRDHPEIYLAALSFDPAMAQARIASELYLTLGDSDLV